MSEEVRVESLSFGSYYCAVIRRPGKPDELLDGVDGRPIRYPSASAAIRAGRDRIVPAAASLRAEAISFRADRDHGLDAERDRVFAKLGGASFKRKRR
jgi:hypothetical protein